MEYVEMRYERKPWTLNNQLWYIDQADSTE